MPSQAPLLQAQSLKNESLYMYFKRWFSLTLCIQLKQAIWHLATFWYNSFLDKAPHDGGHGDMTEDKVRLYRQCF